MSNWLNDLIYKLTEYQRILLICSPGFSKRGELKNVLNAFEFKNIVVLDRVTTLPTIDQIQDLFESINIHEGKFDAIVAIGGGSVIDSAKCILALLTSNSESNLKMLLDKDFKNSKIDPIYFVAVPTTAGTGSEVTSFATVWDSDLQVKRSLENSWLTPADFILDHKLLITLSYRDYFYPALDAISHSVESIWNVDATEKSLQLSYLALELLMPVISKPYEQFEDRDYENLLRGSNFAGSAIAITRTSIAHSISYPLTSRYGVPHGLAASFTIPKIVDIFLENSKIELTQIQQLLFLKNCLLKFNLNDEVKKYCTIDQVRDLVPEMIHASRFEKFVVDLKTNNIIDLIN